MNKRLRIVLVSIIIFILILLVFSKSKRPKSVQPTGVMSVASCAIPQYKKNDTDIDEELYKHILITDVDDEREKSFEIENSYIASLPENHDCVDNYDKCSEWAANGECKINPEYMLFNCSGSCGACNLTHQQKHNVVEIYNNRSPKKCIYHGYPYPTLSVYSLYTI